MKVLFISAWYPNRYDAMAGLFVRKHAESVGMFNEVKVLYIHADKNINVTEIVDNTGFGITETIIYYPAGSNSFSKLIHFFNAYKKGFRHISELGFKPDIIHANILTRTGFIAYIEKKRKGIPYIISEHWSRFLSGKKAFNNILHKYLTQIIVKNASTVLVVSGILKKGMISNGLIHNDYRLINNVVDDFFFNNTASENHVGKLLLHISCFDEKSKNICGIIRAVSALSKVRDDFSLVIIGTGLDFDKVFSFAQSLNLKKGIIRFEGEKTPEEVAEWYRKCDGVVQFSNYETAGIVIAESLVCGKPVISTKVGIAPDFINESNGILVNVGDEKALQEAMKFLLENTNKYNKQQIKNTAAENFSYKNVGAKITEVYLDAIKNQ